ncbi:MAG: hypothetical protein LUC83_00795 [Clostridiales bacterium]|nr:hypothetical protein [Clostridiales bacterium]
MAIETIYGIGVGWICGAAMVAAIMARRYEKELKKIDDLFEDMEKFQDKQKATYIKYQKIIGEWAGYKATGISPDQIRQIDTEYQKLATELAKYKKEERDAVY